MNVQMRHALTNPIVDCHEGSLGRQGRFNCARKKLSILEKGSDQMVGQIGQSFIVCFWNQEAMARENGPMIEKGQRDLIFKNQAGNHFAADDLAKGAG